MSGVNRNILKNTGIPLFGDVTPPEVNLETTSGSRWVILDFLNVNPTSSNGACTGIGLEWSPDPAMVSTPFLPSSSYYSVTSSTFSCNSASLSPQTGSQAWVQFINSYWWKTEMTPTSNPPTKYYLRAYQTRNTNPVRIYSPAVPVETRAEKYCGEIYTSSIVPYPKVVADLDAYNNPGFANKWINDVGDYDIAQVSASFTPSGGAPGTGSVYLVKAGGPNYDAFRFDNGGFNWPQLNISSSTIRCGVGIVKGKAEWTVTSNGEDFLISVRADQTPTTSSITLTKVSNGQLIAAIEPTQIPANIINTYVEIILSTTNDNVSSFRVDGGGVKQFNFYDAGGARGAITLKNNFQMSVSGLGSGYLPNAGIIRCVTAGVPYDVNVFHCKYGPAGSGSYVA